MNLNKIKIENFKCFQSETEIELGKITLLTGANSSGKSSIIYSILGAIQSGEFPFQFSTNGKYVNMGDFNEIVFNHLKKNKIKLSYSFKNVVTHNIETIWVSDPKNNLPKLSALKASSTYYNLNIKYDKNEYVVNCSYDVEKDTEKNINMTFFKEFITSPIRNSTGNNNIYTTDHTKFEEIKDLRIPEISRKNFLIISKSLMFQQIFYTISGLFLYYDENLNFISSFRLPPDRGYLESSKVELKVNNDGSGYLEQIMNWEYRKSEKLHELISILQDLNLLDEIKPKRAEGGRYDLLIKTKKDGVFTSLYDVGFGISQFLPIVVADLQLPYNSTLFVAQPEIHLHPSIQSSFGDYLVKQTKEKEKNYVIETHSEYLLNRIRLAIVKGEIDKNDVKVVFVDNQAEQAVVHKIVFNEDGQILNAPDNFFKTYMMDVMEIAINAAN